MIGTRLGRWISCAGDQWWSCAGGNSSISWEYWWNNKTNETGMKQAWNRSRFELSPILKVLMKIVHLSVHIMFATPIKHHLLGANTSSPIGSPGLSGVPWPQDLLEKTNLIHLRWSDALWPGPARPGIHGGYPQPADEHHENSLKWMTPRGYPMETPTWKFSYLIKTYFTYKYVQFQ